MGEQDVRPGLGEGERSRVDLTLVDVPVPEAPPGYLPPPVPAVPPTAQYPVAPPIPQYPAGAYPAGAYPAGAYPTAPYPVAPPPYGSPNPYLQPPPHPPGAWPPGPGGYAPPGLPPAPVRRRRVGLWIGLVVGALVVVLVGLLAAVGLVLRTGTGSGARPAAPSPGGSAASASADPAAAGVDAVLARMTRALRAKDVNAFLAVVNAEDQALVARERAVFRSMLAVPMAEPTFGWRSRDSDPPQTPGSYPADAIDVPVEFTYRLPGWDPGPVTDLVTYTFAPVHGRWTVVGDTEDVSGLHTSRWAEPWTTSDVIVVTRAHVLVIGEAAHRTSAVRLADRLERVAGDVRRTWAEPTWNGKVVAYAVTDPRFVREYFGDQATDGSTDSPNAKASFEARVASAGAGSQAGGDMAGSSDQGPPRLVVTPWLLGQKDDYSLSVLRHEVTHVATHGVGRYPPIWLVEGAAEYTGFRLGGSHVNARLTLARHGLPRATARAMQAGTWRPTLVGDPNAFYTGSSQKVGDAYIDGWLASLYVADRFGDATLRRLYDVAGSQPASASYATVEATALRQVLHTDRAAFTEAVRVYGIGLRRSLG